MPPTTLKERVGAIEETLADIQRQLDEQRWLNDQRVEANRRGFVAILQRFEALDRKMAHLTNLPFRVGDANLAPANLMDKKLNMSMDPLESPESLKVKSIRPPSEKKNLIDVENDGSVAIYVRGIVLKIDHGSQYGYARAPFELFTCVHMAFDALPQLGKKPSAMSIIMDFVPQDGERGFFLLTFDPSIRTKYAGHGSSGMLLGYYLTPLYRASHRHQTLGLEDRFKQYCFENLKLQLTSDFQVSSMTPFLESHRSFFVQIVRIFIVDDRIFRTSGGLINKMEVEEIGGHVSSSASREHIGYIYDALKTYVLEMVEVLVDSVINPVFLDWEVNEQLQKMKNEVRPGLLLEAIHFDGYYGALANPLLALGSAINRLNINILEQFVAENYTSSLQLVGKNWEIALHQPLLAIEELVTAISITFQRHFSKWIEITRNYVDSMDELLQPLVDEAMLTRYTCRDEWISVMETSLTTYLAKEIFPTYVDQLWNIVPIDARDKLLIKLPPWHAFERASEYFSLTYGVEQVYTTVRNLKEFLRFYQS